MRGARRLFRKNIQAGGAQSALTHRMVQRVEVVASTTCGVDKNSAVRKSAEQCRIGDVAGFLGQWSMQRKNIRRRDQFIKVAQTRDAERLVVAVGFIRIVEGDVQAEPFRDRKSVV